MKITLVTSPFFDHSTFYSNIEEKAQPYMPLGLLALAAYLETHNISVEIADLNLAFNKGQWKNDNDFYQHAAEYIETFNSELTGFLTAYDAYHHTINIAEHLKKKNPEMINILGGYQATVTDLETVKKFSFIDVVVRGEGERTLINLVKAIQNGGNLHSVKGITFRDKDKVIRTENEKLIENLDDLPIPSYHLYPMSEKGFVYLEIGRGCPYECTFCSTAPFWRRRTRYKSVDKIINEIRQLIKEYKTYNFNFIHDLFTIKKTWVMEFCKKIIESNLKINWACSSRTDTVSDELLKMMSEAGCIAIYYGVETGTEKAQNLIKKSLNLKNTKETIKKTREYGMAPVLGFIVGFPFETTETLKASLDEFFEYKQEQVPLAHIFVATPEKGSDLYKENYDTLKFYEHFLDFPLPPKILESNLKLIKANPDIFCGFYRFQTKHFDSKIFYGIDEFSPLVNTLEYPVTLAAAQMENSLEFYLQWVDWIENKNSKRGKPKNEIYYGTIQDMLDFLKYLYSTDKISLSFYSDILKYEIIKNEFRSLLPGLKEQSLGSKYSDNVDSQELLNLKPIQNPLNKIKTFDYDIKEIYEKRTIQESGINMKPTHILYYVSVRPIGRLSDFFKENFVDILTLSIDPVTKILLEICNGQANASDIINCLLKEFAISKKETEKMVLDRLRKLINLNVINFVEHQKTVPTTTKKDSIEKTIPSP
jgi:radical SAM superfamily enzyme YgiQ (UPF0313 family)